MALDTSFSGGSSNIQLWWCLMPLPWLRKPREASLLSFQLFLPHYLPLEGFCPLCRAGSLGKGSGEWRFPLPHQHCSYSMWQHHGSWARFLQPPAMDSRSHLWGRTREWTHSPGSGFWPAHCKHCTVPHSRVSGALPAPTAPQPWHIYRHRVCWAKLHGAFPQHQPVSSQQPLSSSVQSALALHLENSLNLHYLCLI